MYERTALPDVAALYRETRGRIGEVLAGAGPDADGVRVPACPDWTVAELSAHLAGTTAALLARSYPGDDTQGWVDAHVAARHGRSALDNWREWDEVGPDYDALLTKNEPAWGSLLYDAIIHEDDLRHALGVGPARDAAAIDYAFDRLLWKLDEIGRAAGAGTLHITYGDPRSSGTSWTIGDGEPVVRLRGDDRWELLRALASRRSERRLRAMDFDGDPGPWIAIAPHDLPVGDEVD